MSPGFPPAALTFSAKNVFMSLPTRSFAFLPTITLTVLEFGTALTDVSTFPQSPALAAG